MSRRRSVGLSAQRTRSLSRQEETKKEQLRKVRQAAKDGKAAKGFPWFGGSRLGFSGVRLRDSTSSPQPNYPDHFRSYTGHSLATSACPSFFFFSHLVGCT